MNRTTLLAVPYRVARTPVTVFEHTVVQRLPERSAPRRIFERAVGAVDAVAGQAQRAVAKTTSAAQSAAASTTDRAPHIAAPTPDSANESVSTPQARTRTPESAPVEVPAKKVAAKKAAAKKAARKSAPKPDTRANKSLSSLALELAETQAVAEAREHQAEAKVDEQFGFDTSEAPAETDTGTDAGTTSDESLPSAKDMGPKGSS